MRSIKPLYYLVFLIFLSMFLLNACAQEALPAIAEAEEEAPSEIQPHQWPVYGPGEDPEEDEPLDQRSRLQQKVSISFKNMDLKQAVSILAETYDLNILVTEEIKGAITINLKDVLLEDVLTQMLALKDFTYKWEGDIIKVITAEEDVETRKFCVNHVDMDLAKAIVGDLLSEDGKTNINTITNQLIITDTASKLDLVKETLADIDMPPRQVRIETKLIDISHTDLDNLGVSWETSGMHQKIPTGFFGTGAKMDQFDYSNAGTSSTLSNGQFTLGFIQRTADISATIDALVRHTKARVIANPSITTLNNVEARITIGTKYPIREQTQTTTGTLETTRFVDIGTTLKVTPKVNEDGTIQLTVHPEVSSVSSTVDAGPVITTREADTTVIVNDGDALIIAGLLQTQDDVNKSHIPLLGDLPIIGRLFSSRDKDKEQKELVIFMTPRILDVSGRTVRASKGAGFSAIELAGERVNAMEMFYKARDLETGKSLQASLFAPGTRIGEAAKTYEEISKEFPDNYYAEIGLYKAGWLYEKRLKDYEAALSCYRKIVESYPDGEYVAKAKNRIKRLTKLTSGNKGR